MCEFYKKQGATLKIRTGYVPQENSRAERIKLTLMNATRAAVATENLPARIRATRRDIKIQPNAPQRHSQVPTRTVARNPAGAYQTFHMRPNRTHTVLKPKSKLEPRAQLVRYMHGINNSLIKVWNPQTDTYHQARTVDFRLYQHRRDPSMTTAAALLATPAHLPDSPQTLAQARQYKDAADWAAAHDHELDTLDKQNTFRWIYNNKVPKSAKVIH
eukprot:GFKZ01005306.1.p1 GENE.GFKZ01005306.1~~GFKZ01005306.1.p1  ORF type:complete len:216 (+),score=1.44 GFKZ01005306.1:342-989(+)